MTDLSAPTMAVTAKNIAGALCLHYVYVIPGTEDVRCNLHTLREVGEPYQEPARMLRDILATMLGLVVETQEIGESPWVADVLVPRRGGSSNADYGLIVPVLILEDGKITAFQARDLSTPVRRVLYGLRDRLDAMGLRDYTITSYPKIDGYDVVLRTNTTNIEISLQKLYPW